ncbi:hypothetical protein [Saccharothrix yanglingensis]|uniref:Uncharacterized protein n=1 Tax=Saccharothrix yanglingensis TaxID=659496 RepID=A0ABU0WZM6_9PSEU|nr:hypothetical protein [Saccharothrix yanglingensis]MDQ2584928.1 hypothetical protein [Saccharothrix yanglingensis]
MLEFNEDNGAYEWWVAANPGQFVINAEPTLAPASMVLHRVSCRGIGAVPGLGGHIRICGTRRELEARYSLVRRCGSCLG